MADRVEGHDSAANGELTAAIVKSEWRNLKSSSVAALHPLHPVTELSWQMERKVRKTEPQKQNLSISHTSATDVTAVYNVH